MKNCFFFKEFFLCGPFLKPLLNLLKYYFVSSLCFLIFGLPHGSDGKESSCNAGTQVLSLGWEDPLEKEMATHSSILA